MTSELQPCLPAVAADGDTADPERLGTGILPSQALRRFVQRRVLRAITPIDESQIQPASLDLRLGASAYRMRASFLPGADATVNEKIAQYAMHEVQLDDGAVLERGCVYVVRLEESVHLPRDYYCVGNPKSSVGRLDVFTRLIADGATEFDLVRTGYQGPLYAEISPLTFSIVVRRGSRLSQLRIKRGSPVFGRDARRRLHEQVLEPSSHDNRGIEPTLRGALPITINLRAHGGSNLIGYRARRHAPLLDIDRVGHYAPTDYWETITAADDGSLILDPDHFYVLASREAVAVPPDHAAEMVAYDTLFGEFRVHYAGFFDPGFGYGPSPEHGARAVLEVRSHDVPFMVEHGQLIGRLAFEPLAAQPDKTYGADIGSSYQRQGLALSKHFRTAP